MDLLQDAETLGLLLDFDGTLAEIVARPEDARARPAILAALARLAACPDVRLAIVSGRAIDDLRQRLGPLPGAWLVGSHGAELRDPSGRREMLADSRASRPALLKFLELAHQHGPPGLRTEDKGAAVAVHLRGLPSHVTAKLVPVLAARAAELCTTAPVDWLVGKSVLELRARGVEKGRAVRALLERWVPTPEVLFAAGDDATDEELFEAVLDQDGLAAKIGPGATRAPQRLDDPAALERLLEALAEGRGSARI